VIAHRTRDGRTMIPRTSGSISCHDGPLRRSAPGPKVTARDGPEQDGNPQHQRHAQKRG
jgi:hypothetical protein